MTLLSEDIIDQSRAKFNMMYYVLDEYRVEEFVKNSSIMFGLKNRASNYFFKERKRLNRLSLRGH